MSRRIAFTFLLLLFAASPGCNACELPSQCDDCNVILITVDTLRRDRLGLYGYGKNVSPEIDQFFAKGTRFANAISSAPCTNPSVAQLLTGTNRQAARDPRLAERLTKAGYQTAAVVSQHMFRNKQGARASFSRGFGVFNVQRANQRDQHNMTTRNATEVTDLAVDWLDSHNPDQPFFLWVHYFDPHDPYLPPEAFQLFSAKDHPNITGDRRARMKRHRKPDQPWYRAGHLFDAEETLHLRSLYDGEIRYTDAQIGRLLDKLQELHLVERSLIFFTSDHGERLGEEGWWDHCASLHGLELNVPLMVTRRGGPLAGPPVVEGTVSTLDIVPTVLEMVGVETMPFPFDGRNLIGTPPERRVTTAWHQIRTIQNQTWKLYHPNEGPLELFRIGSDRAEQTDLFKREWKISLDLAKELEARAAKDSPVQKRASEILEELRAIGYIQ